MNKTYGITSKFQVTIPKQLRDELQLTQDHRVWFERRGQEIILRKAPSIADISTLLQDDLKRRGWNKTVTEADMKQAHTQFLKRGGTW